MLGERDDLAADRREVLAAGRPAPVLGRLRERRRGQLALADRPAARRHQQPPAEHDRALEVGVRGHPRVARRLLREQPAGRERPAHEPGARHLVRVLADQQRAGGHVDRGVGEPQPLLGRPVPAGLGEGGAGEAREVEQPQPAVRVGDVEQVLAPREPAGVGLDRLAVLRDERDVAVAAGGGVDHRQPRGAVALGVPRDEQDGRRARRSPADTSPSSCSPRGPTGSRRAARSRAAPPAARQPRPNGSMRRSSAHRVEPGARRARRSRSWRSRTGRGRSRAGRWRVACSRG